MSQNGGPTIIPVLLILNGEANGMPTVWGILIILLVGQ